MTGTRSSPPLLCALGWHDPDPLARWNHGYYFSRCRRCRTDLVRTTYAGWHVPRGCKVVWQAQPPADQATAELVVVKEEERTPNRLPVTTLLDRLHEEEVEERSAQDAGSALDPPEQAAPDRATHASADILYRSSIIPDFMEDGAASDRHTASAGAQRLGSTAAPEEPEKEGRKGSRWALFPRFLGASTSAPAPAPTETQPRTPGWWTPAAALFLVLLILMLPLVQRLQIGAADPARRQDATPGSIIEPRLPPPGLYVAARRLNCRMAPGRQAPVVQRLRRSDPVQLLALDRDWASITSGERQCWVQARYLSPGPPA